MKKTAKKSINAQATAAARRREHFANGGTPATWRGRAAVYDSKSKARKNKRACRGNAARGL